MHAIVGIGHIAIRVKDVGRSLDFYVGKLGFREMFRLDRDGRLWLVYLRITDTQYLELFPEGEGECAPARETVGYNHLCLETSDLDATLADLAEKGVSLSSPSKMAPDGNRQAWIEDPDGHRIELMQPSPGCLQLEAIDRLRRETG